MVLKIACHFHVFFLVFLTVATQGSAAEVLTVYSSSNLNAASMAVPVDNQDLTQVSNSVLMAETWLRNHVLSIYPAFNITHIVVGHNLSCSSKTHHHLILPTLKNFHHSLIRWGLHSEIKVSPSISSHCLELSPDLTVSLLKPLLPFIHSTNSSYVVNPSPESTISGKKIESLVSTHLKFLKKAGFLTMESLNFMVAQTPTTHEAKPTMRKLNYILPTPSPEEQPIAKGPGGLPPLVGVGPTISPPSPIPGTPHFDDLSPTHSPHPGHHHHHNLPPCNPGTPQPAPGPVFEPRRESQWCVAKPSVPAETLQEAMDYACGEGGAECDEIQPNGNCYYPDSLFNHASYAFNNYWQKTKINGGTCNFGGAAMLINSDPSFLHCRFILV